MSRLWVVAAAFALLAVAEVTGILALAVLDDRAVFANHWPEVLMLVVPAAAAVALVWCGRAAQPPTQAIVCVGAGLTALALAYGVGLTLQGRGYVQMPFRLPRDASVLTLMGLPAVGVLVAAVALVRDRWLYRPVDPDRED